MRIDIYKIETPVCKSPAFTVLTHKHQIYLIIYERPDKIHLLPID